MILEAPKINLVKLWINKILFSISIR